MGLNVIKFELFVEMHFEIVYNDFDCADKQYT